MKIKKILSYTWLIILGMFLATLVSLWLGLSWWGFPALVLFTAFIGWITFVAIDYLHWNKLGKKKKKKSKRKK